MYVYVNISLIRFSFFEKSGGEERMEVAGHPLHRPCPSVCLSNVYSACVTSVSGGISDTSFIVVTKLWVA
jgi:hypothetical protein